MRDTRVITECQANSVKVQRFILAGRAADIHYKSVGLIRIDFLVYWHNEAHSRLRTLRNIDNEASRNREVSLSETYGHYQSLLDLHPQCRNYRQLAPSVPQLHFDRKGSQCVLWRRI